MNKQVMETMQMFQEIVRELDISQIPLRYIAAASHIDEDGFENVVHDDELEALMAREAPFEYVENVNVLLDIRAISLDMAAELTELFQNIYDQLAEDRKKK